MEISSINPATLEEIGRTVITDPAKVPAIVGRLRSKLPKWSATPLEERTNLIKKAAAVLKKESDSIAELMTKEMGKIFVEAKGEVDNAAYRLEYFARTAPKALEPYEEELSTTRSITRYQPVGVVAVIKPWNFPVGIPLWSIVPALLGGNTVLFSNFSIS